MCLFYKFIATFVSLMFKYLVCILLCAILSSSLNATKNKELLKYQTGIIVPDDKISSYIGSYSYNSSETKPDVSYIDGDSSFNDYISAYKISKGYLPGVYCSRQQTPLKISKCNSNTSIVQILSSLKAPLLGNKGKNQDINAGFVKFSYRYYVYTLRRILI